MNKEKMFGASSGFHLYAELTNIKGPIIDIAWSPTETILALSSPKHNLRFWNLKDNKVKRINQNFGKSHIAWSPDGRFIAATNSKNKLELYDLTQQEQIVTRIPSYPISQIEWSPLGKFITLDDFVEIRLIDAEIKKVAKKIIRYGYLGTRGTAWSPDENEFAAGVRDFLRHWRLDDKNPRGYDFWRHKEKVSDAAWSPSGRFLASLSYDGEIRFIDYAVSIEDRIRFRHNREGSLQSPSSGARGLSFSYNDGLLAVLTQADYILFWRCETWERVGIIPCKSEMGFFRFHLNGNLVAICERISKKESSIKVYLFDDNQLKENSISKMFIKNIDPNYQERLQAFLCHASEDKEHARELHRRLKIDEVKPWLDEDDLLPGQDWQLEIPKAIHESHVVIVLLSKNSVNKFGYVQKEIKFALDVADEQPEGTIYIIPVKLEECEVPQRLRHLHYISLFEDRGYEKLLKALHSRIQSFGT